MPCPVCHTNHTIGTDEAVNCYRDYPDGVPRTMMREVPGHPDYLVSENGLVFSVKSQLWLKPHDNGRGYLHVTLYNSGKRSHFRVHRLVAICYIENPFELTDVDHIDGNRSNNNKDILRWTTHQHNIDHSVANLGTFQYKITQEQMQEIVDDPRPQQVIADHYGVTQSYVSKLKTGAQGPHLCRNI